MLVLNMVDRSSMELLVYIPSNTLLTSNNTTTATIITANITVAAGAVVVDVIRIATKEGMGRWGEKKI